MPVKIGKKKYEKFSLSLLYKAMAVT